MGQDTAETRIRLLLLGDNGLFRAGLRSFLAAEPAFELAGECGTSAEALEAVGGSSVDIVLLDFDIGQELGNGFISAARQAGYRGRFLLIASATDARSAAPALKLCASGICLKSETP